MTWLLLVSERIVGDDVYRLSVGEQSILGCALSCYLHVLSVMTETANAQQTHESAKIFSRERLGVYQASLTLWVATLSLSL
jgi:hypothetical protein